MSTTVHDVWAAALPPGTELVGGQAGLACEVRWVVTLGPRPPGLVGLKGGELVLVEADTLRALDERLTLARAIDRLPLAGVVAIVSNGDIDQAAAQRRDGEPTRPGSGGGGAGANTPAALRLDRRATRTRRGSPTQRFRLELDGIGRMVAAIAADDGARAFLSLIAPHESLGRADAMSASQGATVCALIMARERAVARLAALAPCPASTGSAAR